MKKFLIFAMLLVTAAAYAAMPTDGELTIFAAQKYRVNYASQTPKSKDDIKNEYMLMTILGPKVLAQGMQNDPEYRIAANTLAVEIWSKRFTDSLNIPDATLKKLYAEHELKTPSVFNLRNILVKDAQSADWIVKSLTQIKDATALSDKFEDIAAKQSLDINAKNGGKIGWIEIGKLEANLQNVIENKKKGDVFSLKINDSNWQIFYIEDMKPSRKATFDEAKPTLINVVKKAELGDKIKEMLKTK